MVGERHRLAVRPVEGEALQATAADRRAACAATSPVAAAATALARSALAAQAASSAADVSPAATRRSGALLPDRLVLTYTATAPASAPATAAMTIRRRGREQRFLFVRHVSESPAPGYHDERRQDQQPDVGRTFCLGSGRDHGGDQRLDRLRQARSTRRTSRGSIAHADMLAENGHHRRRTIKRQSLTG